MAPLKPRRPLVFIGFMAAGKTSGARAAAAGLRTQPLDTDQLLEPELGMPIEEFFDRHGEAAFREREEQLALRVLAEAGPGSAISLGGGTLQSERVRAALHDATVVLLDVEPEVAWQRATGRGRPLARDRERFLALHRERTALYERAADVIVPPADRNVVRRMLPALAALTHAPAGTRMVWATAASGEYPVYVGEGLLHSGFWPLARDGARRFVVTDEHVEPLVPELLADAIASFALPPGEESKTLATCERVWTAMVDAAMTRDDVVLALGGGVVGDLAGFCAATYQRGIRVIQAPTTLVSQVDSAYGGKTGVDLPAAKNYVGAYHQPAAVLVDPAILGSLPPGEQAAGYAEVIKTALIAGGPLWERIQAGASGREPDVILACLRTKLAVVAADERDGGRRQSLNLGHTIGHAIETVTGYRAYRHGEAVGLGLLAALRLSGQDALRTEVAGQLAAHGLPTVLREPLDPAEILTALQRDKKRRTGAGVPFVLVEAVGDVRVGCTVADDAVLAAVRELSP